MFNTQNIFDSSLVLLKTNKNIVYLRKQLSNKQKLFWRISSNLFIESFSFDIYVSLKEIYVFENSNLYDGSNIWNLFRRRKNCISKILVCLTDQYLLENCFYIDGWKFSVAKSNIFAWPSNKFYIENCLEELFSSYVFCLTYKINFILKKLNFSEK